jgi:hypothetical protein
MVDTALNGAVVLFATFASIMLGYSFVYLWRKNKEDR